MKSLETIIESEDTQTATTAESVCIFTFEDYSLDSSNPPANYKEIGNLVNEWEKDNDRRAAMEDARRWVADTFYQEDEDTIRTIRMRKGLSQAQLAEILGTSQSHVARIEKGTENIMIDTCRRLAKALEIDMNTLDAVLRQQEKIAQIKAISK
jgi:ribosome-binding protein aMBF1 (putative translation factor)